jgi:hypothetical protein
MEQLVVVGQLPTLKQLLRRITLVAEDVELQVL